MKDAIRALKAERRDVARTLKQIDSALAKIGGGVVRRKRRGKGKRKAKVAVQAKPRAPKKAPAAPKPPQGESLADRKRKKQEALRQREPAEGGE